MLILIHFHKDRWEGKVSDVGLGVSCEYEGPSLYSMRPGNPIGIQFWGEK